MGKKSITAKKGNHQKTEPWMSPPDPMADPMTGGYSRIPTDLGSMIFFIAVAVVPVIVVVISIIAGIVWETIEANTSREGNPTETNTTVQEDNVERSLDPDVWEDIE